VDITKGKKVEIEYPCRWEYRLVGRDEFGIKEYAKRLAGEKPHSLGDSNKSSSGKFSSIIFEVLVYNEDERVYFYEELRKNSDILYIL